MSKSRVVKIISAQNQKSPCKHTVFILCQDSLDGVSCKYVPSLNINRMGPDPPNKYRWSAISNSQYRFSNPVGLERNAIQENKTLEDNQSQQGHRESTYSATTCKAYY